VDGLAFRNDPSIAGALIKRLPLDARLETLESQAEAKIGEHGEWIHVQDSAGDQGYTAAWYVSKTVDDEDTEPPETKPPDQPPDDVEFYLIPIADGLAVRTGPNYNAQLIRRIPLQTKLGYLESREEVKRKVGVVNQWIHVYDASGLQGYTAAWYVARMAGKPPPPPGESPPTTTEPPEEPKPKIPPKPIKGFSVVPTTEGLAFRTQPTVAGNLIKRLPLITTLAVDEPEDQAKQKVGVFGQWLKVKDASGKVGYVAAWYVKTAPKSEEGEGDSEELLLRTTTEGLALRHSPFVADYTLIKRLSNGAIVRALDADADSKIGVHGQWLRIRDSKGIEGYIAAWYVEREG
jgi:hypothetical protein